MKSAAVHRLESLLSTRKLDGTVLKEGEDARLSPVVTSGYLTVDKALGGGWRQGEVSELVGPRSSGRTAVMVSTLAQTTRTGAVVALVDSFDRFDPLDAQVSGVVLDRVLWVRGPALTLESAKPSLVEAAVLRAIRAFDLVLRAGGFAVAALDLADVPPRCLRTLPYATWMRLAHVNEGRPTVGLLLGDEPLGRSARGASVRLTARPRWNASTSTFGRRLDGFDVHPVNLSRGSAHLKVGCSASRPSESTSHGLLSRA
jgi:hypothetical protein